MSGLLRRLAGQAMGGGSSIHSLVRIPYVASTDFIQNNVETDSAYVTPPSQADHSEPTSPAVSARTNGVSQIAAFDPFIEPYQAATTPAESQPSTDATIVSQSTTVEIHASHSQARQQEGNADLPDSAPGHVEQSQNRVTMPRRQSIPTPSTQVCDLTPDVLPAQSAKTASDADRLPIAKSQNGLPSRQPAPLLAPLFAPSPRPVSNREAIPQISGVKEPEVNEVHIHIGRIEVTATQETQAPKRTAAPPRRQPMSLDEYLTKRRGGAS